MPNGEPIEQADFPSREAKVQKIILISKDIEALEFPKEGEHFKEMALKHPHLMPAILPLLSFCSTACAPHINESRAVFPEIHPKHYETLRLAIELRFEMENKDTIIESLKDDIEHTNWKTLQHLIPFANYPTASHFRNLLEGVLSDRMAFQLNKLSLKILATKPDKLREITWQAIFPHIPYYLIESEHTRSNAILKTAHENMPERPEYSSFTSSEEWENHAKKHLPKLVGKDTRLEDYFINKEVETLRQALEGENAQAYLKHPDTSQAEAESFRNAIIYKHSSGCLPKGA